jgi:hypothetical protein
MAKIGILTAYSNFTLRSQKVDASPPQNGQGFNSVIVSPPVPRFNHFFNSTGFVTFTVYQNL